MSFFFSSTPHRKGIRFRIASYWRAKRHSCIRSKNTRQASISPCDKDIQSLKDFACSEQGIWSWTMVWAACWASAGAGWREPSTASTALWAIALPVPSAIPCITVPAKPAIIPPPDPGWAGGGAVVWGAGGGGEAGRWVPEKLLLWLAGLGAGRGEAAQSKNNPKIRRVNFEVM